MRTYRMSLRIVDTNPQHTRIQIFDNGGLAGELCLSKEGLKRLAHKLSLEKLLIDSCGVTDEWVVQLPEEGEAIIDEIAAGGRGTHVRLPRENYLQLLGVAVTKIGRRELLAIDERVERLELTEGKWCNV